MNKIEIQFSNISFGYNKTPLISNFDCELISGKINLVIGRAGSGKSTFLKTISGFIPTITGKAFFKDTGLSLEENVTIAFQNPEQLFFNATVGEEVCYALQQQGIAYDLSEEKGKKWLEQWGLPSEKFWNRHPFSLSGGEKRRVALAATTILQSPVILLDEPFAGLDSEGQKQLLSVLIELSKEHLLIVVTHDPEKFLKFAGKVLLLNGDQIRSFDKKEDFLFSALKENDLYPLPGWYRKAIKGFENSKEKIPCPEAKEVYHFIKEQNG